MRTTLEGNLLQIDFLHDATWQDKAAASTPRIMVSTAADPSARAVVWERMDPGHYRSRVQLGEGELLYGSVRVGDTVLPFGPVLNGQDAEWRQDPARVRELMAVSRETGGREITDLTEIWKSPTPPRTAPVEGFLWTLFLILFVLDALLTRLDVVIGRAFL